MYKILYILLWPLRFSALKLSYWLIKDSNSKQGEGKFEVIILGACAVLLALKLCGVITWSMWWIFAPLWLSVVVFLAMILLLLVFGFIVHVMKKSNDKDERRGR